MANEAQLALLRQGVEGWNKWRENNPKVEIDLSGANLRKANLRDANLREADLRKVDLTGADLTRAAFLKANLSEARLSFTDLSLATFLATNLCKAKLRGAFLFRTEFYKADLSEASLTKAKFSHARIFGTNLSRAVFQNTDFIDANLSTSDFSQSNLRKAQLVRTQALDTNFNKATFTGACLVDCHTNSATNLDDVICEYVYLQHNQQERRPSSGNFSPGEFTKLFQKALETVDLIFSNGIDWRAFLTSFEKLQVECGGEELSIQAIENKNDGVLVIHVNVPHDANKAEIEKYLKQEYELELKAIEEKYRVELQSKDREIIEIYRQNNSNIVEIVKTLAISQSITIQNIATAESNAVSESFNNDLREANVANFANKVQDHACQQANQYIYESEQQQTLAEAVEEIQNLLKVLEKTNPTATEAEKKAFVTSAIPPERRSRIVRALEAGGEKALEEFLKNPYVNVAVAVIKEWQKAE